MADNNSSINEEEERPDSKGDGGLDEGEEEPSLFGDNADDGMRVKYIENSDSDEEDQGGAPGNGYSGRGRRGARRKGLLKEERKRYLLISF